MEGPSPHTQMEAQLGSARHRYQVDLLDIESQRVDPLDPLGDPVPLPGGDDLVLPQLAPDVPVALGDLLAHHQVGLVE